jgi:hypothetical protein
MSSLSPLAQEAQRKMDRAIRIRDVAQESYAVIAAIHDRKTPPDEIARWIRKIVQQVEGAE